MKYLGLAVSLLAMAFFFSSCPGSPRGGSPLALDGFYKPIPPDMISGEGLPDLDISPDIPVVPCGSDEDCENGWVCDPASNVCVQCYEDAHCHKDGYVCIDNACVELAPCDEDTPCPPGLICDFELGVCVECLTDDDCEDGYECNDGFCEKKKPYCDDETPCPDGMHCNVHTNECVYCLDDTHCADDQWCDIAEGECKQDLCNPGETVCVSGGVKQCKENGSGYGDTMPCPEGTMCENGECVSVQICTPGISHCINEAAFKLCNWTGDMWEVYECQPGEKCVDEGEGHALCVGKCDPNCEKTPVNFCGPDANDCGYLCDICQPGYSCPEGVMGLPPGTSVPCEEVCTCEGKECGFDNCGNSCGICPGGFLCQAGVCIYVGYDCEQGFECVLDCGAGANEQCVEKCIAATNQEFQGLLLDFVECIKMYCGGAVVPWCAEEVAMLQCEKYAVECMVCQADCFGKECGDDGCGGDCGMCPAGFKCNNYKCVGLGGCEEILTCIENSDAPPDIAIPMCMAAATPDAQAQFLKLASCVQDICGDFVPGSNCYYMAINTACGWDYEQCKGCVPYCTGKECGKDGCGGWCGFCPMGSECYEGICQCIPNCVNKECGPDNCGNQCGICPDGFQCTDYGKCVCPPNCVNKDCGGDGCGGLCGFCIPGQEYCTENGSCLPFDCEPGMMDCDGNLLLICSDDGTWESLGLCPEGSFCMDGTCVPWVCVPGETMCQGNGIITCADNGAGWLPVMLCPVGTSCKAGKCVPATGCGDIPKVGCCDGTIFMVCENDSIIVQDCGNMGCGWIPNWGYGCGGSGADPNGQFPLQCPGCEPKCAGKECGDDGCGGNCGLCPPGFICDAGVCEEFCLPDCIGKECGKDGCKGVCGLCAGDEFCLNGQCVVPPTCEEMLFCAEGCFGEGDKCFELCTENADQSEQSYAEFKAVWLCITEYCAGVEDQQGCFKTNVKPKCYGDYIACLSCTPDCDIKVCGPDGCGGTCGVCPDKHECQAGVCVPVCIPDCEGKDCGDNGCEGECGLCKLGYECIDFQCEFICKPQCIGKQCGPDTCGGFCGFCDPGFKCSNFGMCVPEFECGDGFCDKAAGENSYNCPKDCGQPTNGCEPWPFPGCGGCMCEACVCEMDPYCCDVEWDMLCVEECIECGGCCEPNCGGNECGPDGCGGTCGECEAGYECVKGDCEIVCIPDCEDKECGSDDCKGTCGTCPEPAMCKNYKCFYGKSCGQLVQCSIGCVEDMGAECLFACLEQGTPEAQSEFFDVVQCVLWQCGLNLSLDCMMGALAGACSDEYAACQQCSPDCTGKQCGPNGCGGSCGTCDVGFYCDNYKCKKECKPDCVGKECGDNGCAGSCGTCPDDEQCNDDGICEPVCVPQCAGKQCGPDTCGNLCGLCPAGMICTPLGMCKPAGPLCGDGQCQQFEGGETCVTCPDDCGKCIGDCCKAHDSVGCQDPAVTACVCEMDFYCCEVMWDGICANEAQFDCNADCGCVPNCKGKECGSDGCGGQCGKCPPKYACDQGICEPICMPSCMGKQCGPDGCDGSCGTCPDGFKCDAGTCVPYCTIDCVGKECGPDGCNGLCGLCGPDEVCLIGQCQVAWDCELLLNCLWDCPEDDEACYDYCWDNASPEAQEQYIVIWECILEVCGPEPVEPCPGQAVLNGECKDEFDECLDCTPQCTGKQCGPDGCGGDCGECPPGYECDVYGYCDCIPNCDGKECGNDGCGGECGQCPNGYLCNMFGSCVCMPDCADKECGSDSCGGSCGKCPDGFVCSKKGKCKPECVPNCTASDGSPKQCGGDGCGGNCGICPPGLICTPQGKCKQAGPVCGDEKCEDQESCLTCPKDCGNCSGDCCQAHDAVGCNDMQVTKCVCEMDPFCCEVMWDDICADIAIDMCDAQCGCVPNCTGKECGSDGCGGSCGWCPPNAWCDQDGQCIITCEPECEGKECGPDNCGGSCGACAIGYQCNSQGQCVCVPDCWNKECGSDGCGGSCGECGQFQSCTGSGKCKFVTPLCGDGQCWSWIGEDCDSCPGDCGVCCGNGMCEPKYQETCKSCSDDCGVCCGNGFCDVQFEETCENCPQDCGPCPALCGDNICNEEKGETCANCPQDCGPCPDECGDGKCDMASEDCNTCPEDCGPCAGSCCIANGTPGCQDPQVQACVCQMDPYCCNTQWDGICAGEADDCGSCNGDCCKANPTPGCDDEDVEECVCDGDMYCCNSKWDASCAALVEELNCGDCQTGPFCGDGQCNGVENCYTCATDCGKCCGNGECEPQFAESCASCSLDCGACPGQDSCCTPHDTPGCMDQEVEWCVCQMDPYCCNNQWDATCASEADQCGSCNGDCCEGNPTPGCDDEEIEECVCSMIPYCCEKEWDQKCAGSVEMTGCGQCGCIPNCQGKECGDDGCGGSCGECPFGETCSNQGQCQGSQGDSCGEILQCTTTCGGDWQCMMNCVGQGSPEGQALFMSLINCVMIQAGCGFPPDVQCMMMAFMTTCSDEYQECMSD